MRSKPFYRRPLFHTIAVTVFLLGVYAGIAWWTQNELTPVLVAFDLLLAALAFLAMTALTAQFVLPVRSQPDQPQANPRLTVIQRLLSYPIGNTGPVMFIQNGKPVESQRERERPGAGVLLVDYASAAVLRTDTHFTRAVGPGTYFTFPGERLSEALDLRRQARGLRGSPPATGEPIEQDAPNARALTKDGISISADLGVVFMLDPGHSGPPREGRHPNLPPYEFNATAAERAVYGHAYEETRDVPWVDLPLRLVVDLWREQAGNWMLEALLTARQKHAAPSRVIHPDSISFARFSKDGAQIVTACGDGTARVWDANTGAEVAILEGRSERFISLGFDRDGSRIIAAGEDNVTRVWEAETGQELLALEGHTGEVLSARFSEDGSRIVTASIDGTVRVWDALTGADLLQLRNPDGPFYMASFSRGGGRIITANGDGTAQLWDAVTGTQQMLLTGHSGEVYTADISPDGTWILTTSKDETAGVWDATQGSRQAVLEGHTGKIHSASFSPNGRLILTASADGTARMWDASTGALRTELEGHGGEVYAASYSPDGSKIVTGSADGTARLWDAGTGEQKAVLTGHTGEVYAASFSPDGSQVLTGGGDGTARLWEVETGHELEVLEPPSPLQVIQRQIQQRLSPSSPAGKESLEYDVLHSRGIRILGVGISNIYLPEDVRNERQHRWREAWIQSVQETVTEANTLESEAHLRGQRAAYETLAFEMTETLRAELSKGNQPSRRDTLIAMLDDSLEICRRNGLHVARGKTLEAQLRQIRGELSRLDGNCQEP